MIEMSLREKKRQESKTITVILIRSLIIVLLSQNIVEEKKDTKTRRVYEHCLERLKERRNGKTFKG